MQKSSSKWENGNTETTLISCTDVNVLSVSNNQVLKYNSTSQKWENSTLDFNPSMNSVQSNDILVYNTTNNTWSNLSSLVRYKKMQLHSTYSTVTCQFIPEQSTGIFPKGFYVGYKISNNEGQQIYYSFTLPFDYKLNTPLILQLCFFTANTPTAEQNKTTISILERTMNNQISITLNTSSTWSSIYISPTNSYNQFAGISSINTPIGFIISRLSGGLNEYTDFMYLVEANLIYQTDSYCSSSYTDKT